MSVFETPRAYYGAAVGDFLAASSDSVLGALTARSPFAVEPPQRDAWAEEIALLKDVLTGIEGALFLEFDVPRVGSRIDAVLVSGAVVFVIEFKVGERVVHQADRAQVWDYALDLKNFHKASHDAAIVPILVLTEDHDLQPHLLPPADDLVYPPMICGADGLRRAIEAGHAAVSGAPIDAGEWKDAPYYPTPTIIEAAQALYANHSVDAIARHDAGARNLRLTATGIEAIIDDARAAGRKAIIFVTGVPGAGKTRVGLDVATRRRDASTPTHAVFLSGNGPLVSVLTEALARDELRRQRVKGARVTKTSVRQQVRAFIQNVHHFRDEGLIDPTRPPVDHVVIFDEAQRAWNREMTRDFMRRKKGRPGFTQSEPEFLLSYLDRHADWAVVICLVGGGQEINRGEAGISEWLDAMAGPFRGWTTYVSPQLTDSEYAAGRALDRLGSEGAVVRDDRLHLSVSMRSFRAEHVSRFVKAVLDVDREGAASILRDALGRYPIVLTRDLETARNWVRGKARGSERYGMVVSSGAQRLKPHAVDVRVAVDPIHWFLNDPSDTRSSFYLEDAATEFQVQGLEVDWACVTWDADFRAMTDGWSCHSFVASRWHRMLKAERQTYLKNAYRVLLTRARQGMVICVPRGHSADPTRAPQFYDPTFDYLAGLGIPTI